MRILTSAVLVASLPMTARAVGFGPAQSPSPKAIPVYGYTVVHAYPHDKEAFTQGLQYVDGDLYEGTGLNGRSSIRLVRLESGEVVRRRAVADQYFGEGITVWGAELFQLTWRSGVALVYDKGSFSPTRTFKYEGEGWGLTHNQTDLIMSDGTDALRFIDPKTFVERRRVKVTAQGASVDRLNELEFVKGEVFANIWQTDYVARIDPATGVVTGWIDLRGLLTRPEQAGVDVLNGIAYDEANDRLFVTGKLWPKVFEVRLMRKS